MTPKLLNPKVHHCKRMYLTQKKLNSILKKLKQKKYGFKDYAVEVEEVELTLDKLTKYRSVDSSWQTSYQTLKPGTYFNLYLEYIV